MDPDANLREQLEIATEIIAASDEDEGISEVEAVRLAELMIALDEWIRRGGFLPDAWRL